MNQPVLSIAMGTVLSVCIIAYSTRTVSKHVSSGSFVLVLLHCQWSVKFK